MVEKKHLSTKNAASLTGILRGNMFCDEVKTAKLKLNCDWLLLAANVWYAKIKDSFWGKNFSYVCPPI